MRQESIDDWLDQTISSVGKSASHAKPEPLQRAADRHWRAYLAAWGLRAARSAVGRWCLLAGKLTGYAAYDTFRNGVRSCQNSQIGLHQALEGIVPFAETVEQARRRPGDNVFDRLNAFAFQDIEPDAFNFGHVQFHGIAQPARANTRGFLAESLFQFVNNFLEACDGPF